MEKRKAAFHNLGCKVNAYETEAMQQLLEKAGYEIVPFAPGADVYVINTCTVTNMADRKSRQMLHKAKKMNPHAIVVAAGCYVQAAGTELEEDSAIDIIIGNNRKKDLVSILEHYERSAVQESLIDINHTKEYEKLSLEKTVEHTRAYLKVQDGCNQFCSYCIIPYARGRVRSMPLEAAVAQATGLAAEGYREIVINGIEISSWGWEWKDGSCLRQLLAALCEAVPGVRIRLGSLEPRTIDEAFCKALSGYPNLCPQFHLSLQSGSDTVLKRMHRKYDTARYLESVRLLRQYFPGCAVTTDLIVGFPGETEEEFSESLAFLKTCGLSMFHIFPYSRRKGTPAADMPGQIPNAVKERRAAEAASAAAELEAQYHTSMLGTTQQVLFEQEENGLYAGHAMNYVKVYVQAADLHNEIRAVRVTELYRDGVLGELE